MDEGEARIGKERRCKIRLVRRKHKRSRKVGEVKQGTVTEERATKD